MQRLIILNDNEINSISMNNCDSFGFKNGYNSKYFDVHNDKKKPFNEAIIPMENMH